MNELDQLLQRIADGEDSPAVVERARALLREDVRLPNELREIGLEDDDPQIAASALLGVLGLDDGIFGGLLSEAIGLEAGEPSASASDEVVTAAQLAEQESEWGIPVADAVRAESGVVDLSYAWSGGLEAVAQAVRESAGDFAWEGERPWADVPVADAVRHESHSIELWPIVSRTLFKDWAGMPIRDAVTDGGGQVPELWSSIASSVDADPGVPVADAVRDQAGSVDLVSDVMLTLAPATTEIDVPAAANSSRFFMFLATAAVAAVALLAVAVQFSGNPGASVTSGGEMEFAKAGEVILEEMSYDEDVEVIVTLPDDEGDRPMIIRIYEEV